MSQQLWDVLQPSRESFASRPALRIQERQYTFQGLYTMAEQLAEGLLRAGVGSEEIVGLALNDFLPPALVATWKLGLPAALLSPKYSSSELEAISRKAGITCFVTTSSHASTLQRIMGGGIVTPLPFDQLAFVRINAGADATDLGRLLEEAALLKFTSGSTGEPKGIVLGPDAVQSEARNIVETLELTPEDRILASVPIFHSYGFDLGVLASLFSGAELVLQDFFVPTRIASDLTEAQINVFLGVPNLYRRWLESAPASVTPIPGLRYLLSCTAPLDPQTILAFHERFRMPICQHYGSSETGAVTNQVPAEVVQRPGSIGVPMKNVTVRICNSDGTLAAPGEEGELVVQSRATARGYLMGAPTDKQPFREDGFWTGDLAVGDAAGFVTLRGRLDHIINVGGFKVSPDEVRQVLESHPAVREAGVFGVRTPVGDQTVAAVIALKTQVTEKEIVAFCHRRLADYKVPRRIEFCRELPRGPSGKVRLTSFETPTG